MLCSLIIIPFGCSGSSGNGDDDDIILVTVSGSVYDTSNDPIEGAQVRITSDPVTVITDTQGYFSAMVVPGSHTITITKSHMDIYIDTFSCSEEEPLDLGNIMTSYDPGAALTRARRGGAGRNDGGEVHIEGAVP